MRRRTRAAVLFRSRFEVFTFTLSCPVFPFSPLPSFLFVCCFVFFFSFFFYSLCMPCNMLDLYTRRRSGVSATCSTGCHAKRSVHARRNKIVTLFDADALHRSTSSQLGLMFSTKRLIHRACSHHLDRDRISSTELNGTQLVNLSKSYHRWKDVTFASLHVDRKNEILRNISSKAPVLNFNAGRNRHLQV